MKPNINIAQIFSTVQPRCLLDTFASGSEEQPPALEIPDGALTTDYGNSFRFIHGNRGKVLYCDELNTWAIWSGTHWAMDTCGRILRIGAETARNIMLEARGELQLDLRKWSKQCQSPARINAMLKLAAPEMAISWGIMDTDPYLLNVQNGTINLRTGELLPHNPAHMNSKIADVEFKPEAACPRLLRYLDSAFPDNPEMIRYMQKVVGYVLTGDTREKCFFIFYGPGGNNGKSVLINVIRYILGPYALQTPVATLQSKKQGATAMILSGLRVLDLLRHQR
jgi:putative DNA primase/helicase